MVSFRSRVARIGMAFLMGAASPALSQQDAAGDAAFDRIEQLASRFSDVDDALRGMETAPESTWVSTDKAGYKSDLDELLDAAFEVALPDTYAQAKATVRAIDARADALRNAVSELRIKRLTAPDAAKAPADSSVFDRFIPLSGFSSTKQQIDTKIASLESEAAATEKEKLAAVDMFRRNMEDAYRVSLNERQAEAALYQVNGESIASAHLVTSTLVGIEARLKEIVALGIEPDIARRYYGVAVLSRLILHRMHEKALADYNNKWLPKISDFRRAAENRIETSEKQLSGKLNSAQRQAVEANIKVDRRSLSVIEQYAKVLRQRQEVTAKLEDTAKVNADIAIQTYRTHEGALALDELIGASALEFDTLVSLKAPDLLPLDDKDMFREFLAISERLEQF